MGKVKSGASKNATTTPLATIKTDEFRRGYAVLKRQEWRGYAI